MLDIPTHMDYRGQAKAEMWSRIIITLSGVIGLIYGGFVQQFSQTVYFLGGGFLLASLVGPDLKLDVYSITRSFA